MKLNKDGMQPERKLLRKLRWRRRKLLKKGERKSDEQLLKEFMVQARKGRKQFTYEKIINRKGSKNETALRDFKELPRGFVMERYGRKMAAAVFRESQVEFWSAQTSEAIEVAPLQLKCPLSYGR